MEFRRLATVTQKYRILNEPSNSSNQLSMAEEQGSAKGTGADIPFVYWQTRLDIAREQKNVLNEQQDHRMTPCVRNAERALRCCAKSPGRSWNYLRAPPSRLELSPATRGITF